VYHSCRFEDRCWPELEHGGAYGKRESEYVRSKPQTATSLEDFHCTLVCQTHAFAHDAVTCRLNRGSRVATVTDLFNVSCSKVVFLFVV